MVIAEPEKFTASTSPLTAGSELSPQAFQQIRKTLVLDCCKWDPQVGDVPTLSPFPLFLGSSHWKQLSTLAALLAAELLEAECELLTRTDLHSCLGIPRALRRLLRNAKETGTTPAAARVLRFDFHWTTKGWQISEVNSDVPGGFSEGSELPALVAEHYPGSHPAGNPGAIWAKAIAASLVSNQPVALLAAPGFLEDQQVVNYLARSLLQIEIPSHCISPRQLCWQERRAYIYSPSELRPLGAIVRFVQAEWLNPRRDSMLFAGGQTPVANPGIAVLTESKRFPLVWDQLSTRLPTWRRLLPQTVDPREVDWGRDESWLLKSAFCNTGDTVSIRSLLPEHQWRSVKRIARWHPGKWIAQKKFEIRPIDSTAGMIYPCIGVYTVNGQPAGIYGRFSCSPLIDFAAVDVAVLIR